jgi:hypothetical protein
VIARLGRDERGAIALIAALAYVQGVGAVVLQREQLQDAADAAAFSSAVLHARGMNVLALLNMLMAALLAVLVALKLVEVITGIAIVAISVIAFFLPGAAAAIPPIGQLRSGVIEAHDALSPGIHTALEAMHVAATGVRTLVPVASQANALEIVANQPGSPAQVGFAVPMRATLPTEDGSFAQICAKSGDYVGDLTRWALEALHVGGEIGDIVSEATSDLVRSRGEWFCGDEGSSPPKTTVEHRYTFPHLRERARCEAIHPDASGYSAEAHATVCDEAERAELDSEPNARGDCAGASYATGEPIECDDPRHPYHVRAWLARRDCAPEADDDDRGKRRDFQYQEHRFTRTYLFEDGRWKVASTGAEERSTEHWEHVRERSLRPCGRRHAPIESAWNDGRDARSDGTDLPAVCSDVAPPDHTGYEGERHELPHREVTRVFGCGSKTKRRHEVEKSEGGQPADAEREVPQRLVEGAQLGMEPFQIRAGVIGAPFGERTTRLLALATFGAARKTDSFESDPSQALGRIAVAQAEHYYDGPELADPASYLWSMHWRARLRRFTWPGGEADASVDAEDAAAFSAGAIEVSFATACASAVAAFGADEDGDPCALLRDRADEIVH